MDRTGSRLPEEAWYIEHWDQVTDIHLVGQDYRPAPRAGAHRMPAWRRLDPRALALMTIMVIGLAVSFVL